MTRKRPQSGGAGRAQGLTLVELLVAMAIGLVLMLAVTSTVSVGESHKRTTIATNDMNQAGVYAAYVLDRAVRSAGSGFAQSWSLGVYGCKLNAARESKAILPRTTAFPAPFAAFLAGSTANLRMAPVLIAKDKSSAGSDVLVVMGGNAAAGDVPRPIRSSGSADNILRLDTTAGLAGNALALVSQAGGTDCLLEQVAPTFADSASNELLTLEGSYYTAGTTTTLASLAGSGSAFLTPLSNASARDVQFQLFGVGADRTLFTYDLLRSDGTDTAQAIADGVMEMHAIYGLDIDGDGKLDTWKAPDAAGYDIATMMTTPDTARQVVAIRLALLLRSTKPDGPSVSPQIPAMFADTPAALPARALSGTDQRYRYRLIETTIPLRNALLLQPPPTP